MSTNWQSNSLWKTEQHHQLENHQNRRAHATRRKFQSCVANSPWIQVGNDIDGYDNDGLGQAVAMSGDGNRVAVAATVSVGGGRSAGQVQE